MATLFIYLAITLGFSFLRSIAEAVLLCVTTENTLLKYSRQLIIELVEYSPMTLADAPLLP